MKQLFLAIILSSLFSFPLFAQSTEAELSENKASIFLSYCTHIGTGVSYSFQSCANSNFSNIARNLNGYLSHCMNVGNEVSYGFTSCVNNNFSEIQRRLKNAVWMQHCMNFDRQKLDYSFVSCVNSNYSTIQRYMNQN